MSAAVLNPSHRILQGYLAVTWYAPKLCENKRGKKRKKPSALQIISVKMRAQLSGRKYEKSALGHMLFFSEHKAAFSP